MWVIRFWNAIDLERKLSDLQSYYNLHRPPSSLDGDTPAEAAGSASQFPIQLGNFHWQPHCKELYQLPIAACVRIRQGQAEVSRVLLARIRENLELSGYQI
ncbi:MAG: hypothetical protein GY703_05865 [Gammaproteobacteria bacterium]|nr:hypothetical protein [Gammaproteobacteria bacterium]